MCSADQSARYAPIEWARTAIALYRQHKADRVVARTVVFLLYQKGRGLSHLSGSRPHHGLHFSPPDASRVGIPFVYKMDSITRR
jgi:hypothetical protein